MKKIISCLVILILGYLFLANNLNKPFYGHHDFNSVYYSNMARNYLRYDLKDTKLGQITNTGLTWPENFHFHTHHPSLLPILLSTSFIFFNLSEWSARLIPLLFSLGSLLLLFYISKKLKFSDLASFSSTLVMATPMLRYFGKMPVHEPLIIFFSLLSVLFYLNFTSKPTKKNLYKLLITAFLNGLTGWPGYFLYPLLTIHAFIFFKKKFKLVLLTNLSVLIAFLIHLFQTYLVTGKFFGGGLIKALLFRLNLNSTASSIVQFDWPKYLVQQARWLAVYYTIVLLIIGLIFLTITGYKLFKTKKISLPTSIILLYLAFALVYPILFSNAVFIHDYLNIFFVPFLSLSLAWIVNTLNKKHFYLALIFAILIGLGIFIERYQFNQANQKSNMHLTGYKLGKLINQLVPEGEPAAIFSINYANHHEVFIKYYADRQLSLVGYGQDGLDTLNQELPLVKHAFTVTTHKLDNNLVDQTLATQSAQILPIGEFIYYQLNKDGSIK